MTIAHFSFPSESRGFMCHQKHNTQLPVQYCSYIVLAGHKYKLVFPIKSRWCRLTAAFSFSLETILKWTIFLIFSQSREFFSTVIIPIDCIPVKWIRCDETLECWFGVCRSSSLVCVLLCVDFAVLEVWSSPLLGAEECIHLISFISPKRKKGQHTFASLPTDQALHTPNVSRYKPEETRSLTAVLIIL